MPGKEEEASGSSDFKYDKLPNPPVLSGDRKKDDLGVRQWVVIMREHLLLREIPVNSAKSVHYASLFLRGRALTWLQGFGATATKSNFDRWLELLIKALVPVNEEIMAISKLERLQQRFSLDAYADEFEALCLQIPAEQKSQYDRVRLFIDGCKPFLREKLRPAMVGQSSDLVRCMELAHVFEAEYLREMARERKLKNFSNTSAKSLNTSPAAPKPPFHPSGRDSRKCYACGAVGHIKANCPKAKAKGKSLKTVDASASGSSNA